MYSLYNIDTYIYIYYEGTGIHGSFDRENRHCFCAQNFAPSPHFIPKIIAAPVSIPKQPSGSSKQSFANATQHMQTHYKDGNDTLLVLQPPPHSNATYTQTLLSPRLYTKDRDRIDTLLPRRDPIEKLKHSCLWPGPHWNAPACGRDRKTFACGRAETLLPMAGTAWKHSSLGPGPHCNTPAYMAGTALKHSGSALKHSGLWPGLHWNAPACGRDRIETLLPMAKTAMKDICLWPGPRWNTPAYGRDRTETLLPRPGTAWPQYNTPAYGQDHTEALLPLGGSALKRSHLWPGLHWNTHAYARDRNAILLPMAGTTMKDTCLNVSMMTCRCGPLPRVWPRSCFQIFAGPVHKFAQFRLTS